MYDFRETNIQTRTKVKPHSLVLGILLCTNALAFSGEYWIRPDGTDGTGDGSAANPWVRTTANSFDTLMKSSSIPAGSTIHLMPGTFQTLEGIHPKDRWKIRGAGIDVTVLKIASQDGLTNYYDPNGFPAIGDGYFRHDGVEVSDLTVDCNLQGTTEINVSMHAVVLHGNDTRISRVKAVNWGSTRANRECWILQIGAHPYSPGIRTNCIIEDCIIGPPAPVSHAQGATAISIGGGPNENGSYVQTPGDGWIENAEIRNNTIMGITPGITGHPNYFNGIGPASFVKSAKCTGNRVINVSGCAIYGSCGSVFDLVIENNLLINVGWGVAFVGADACGTTNYTKERIQVINNYITAKDGGSGITLAGYGQRATNFIVKGNTVLSAGSSKSNLGIGFWDADHVTFENNVVDGVGGDSSNLGFVNNNSTFASIKNNQSTSGLNVVAADDREITLNPTQSGWYRLLQSWNSGYASGTIQIQRDHSGWLDNTANDAEFTYSVSAYTDDPRYLGVVNILRSLNHGGGGVQGVRIGNMNWKGSDAVYLDIYLASAPAGFPIRIKASSSFHAFYLPAPLFVGTTNMPGNSKTLSFGKGLRTSDPIVVGTNEITLNDQSGKVLNSALNVIDPSHGGLGVNASSWTAGMLPYTTATGTFGSAPVSAFGLSVLNSTSSQALAGALETSINTNKSFHVLPPDAYIQFHSGPAVTLNVAQTLTPNSYIAWHCPSNSNTSLRKSLPLPNEYWSGRTNFVNTWRLRTTAAGIYSFAVANAAIYTNNTSANVQKFVTFTAPTGTNYFVVAATNSIPTAELLYLDAAIYTGNQVQPGDFLILSGKVSAQ